MLFTWEDVTHIPQEISPFGAAVCWLSIQKIWSKGGQKNMFYYYLLLSTKP